MVVIDVASHSRRRSWDHPGVVTGHESEQVDLTDPDAVQNY
jgi:hypothetical protein